MGRRRKKPEEHRSHEAWAIPYGDLVTLLLAFFVVMYAISSVNEGKYRVLSDSLVSAFRGTPRTLEPVQVGQRRSGANADKKSAVMEQSMLQGEPRSLLTPVPIETGLPQRADSSNSPAANAAQDSLDEVADKVARAMNDLVQADLVVVRHNRFWIEVEIRTDILFPSGSAHLAKGAEPVIAQLAQVLHPFPNAIRVEGHTDDRPISTLAFPSNWELSAARAASVVHLFAKSGVDPSRLAVIGLGEFRPAKANDTREGRNANRRVIIVILSADSAATKDVAAPRDAVPPAPNSAPHTEPELAPQPAIQTQPADSSQPALSEKIAQAGGTQPAP
jgi:chemotaxis protein MotB